MLCTHMRAIGHRFPLQRCQPHSGCVLQIAVANAGLCWLAGFVRLSIAVIPQGHVFTDASRRLHAQFTAAWAGMLKLEYDILSLKAGPSGAWAIDCSTFLRIMYDMDKRLGHMVFMVSVFCVIGFCLQARSLGFCILLTMQRLIISSEHQVQLYLTNTFNMSCLKPALTWFICHCKTNVTS